MPAWRRSSARACGHAGSGAEYLFHTVTKLEEHGIRDRNLWQLQHLVAEEIQRLHPTLAEIVSRNHGQFRRVAEQERRRLTFTLDGVETEALEGDTVLTAILTQRGHLRIAEFTEAPRAGFCLMGACQDCWVATARRPRFARLHHLCSPRAWRS